PGLPITLNNLALRLQAKKRFMEALGFLKEGLAIAEGLAELNPDTYLRDLATCTQNMGAILEESGRFDDAAAALKKAVSLRRRLVERSPEFLRPLAVSLFNLGKLHARRGQTVLAVRAAREAVESARRALEHGYATAREVLGLSLVLVATQTT